jgi:hypothetical protein
VYWSAQLLSGSAICERAVQKGVGRPPEGQSAHIGGPRRVQRVYAERVIEDRRGRPFQRPEIHAAGGDGRSARDLEAETRAAAQTAMDTSPRNTALNVKGSDLPDQGQGPRGAARLSHDFPADHGNHLRTGNPIESVSATVRHRSVRTKGALWQKTAKLMVFKLVQAAAKTWRRLKGANQLPLVIEGITFTDVDATRHTENRVA